jgi:hypothetical protein
MKTTCSLLLVLVLLGLSAFAQTTPASSGQTPAEKTAHLVNRKAKKYNSPVVVANTEELGQKIQQTSRPANLPVKMKPTTKQ